MRNQLLKQYIIAELEKEAGALNKGIVPAAILAGAGFFATPTGKKMRPTMAEFAASVPSLASPALLRKRKARNPNFRSEFDLLGIEPSINQSRIHKKYMNLSDKDRKRLIRYHYRKYYSGMEGGPPHMRSSHPYVLKKIWSPRYQEPKSARPGIMESFPSPYHQPKSQKEARQWDELREQQKYHGEL